jgi:hypothetical protein
MSEKLNNFIQKAKGWTIKTGKAIVEQAKNLANFVNDSYDLEEKYKEVTSKYEILGTRESYGSGLKTFRGFLNVDESTIFIRKEEFNKLSLIKGVIIHRLETDDYVKINNIIIEEANYIDVEVNDKSIPLLCYRLEYSLLESEDDLKMVRKTIKINPKYEEAINDFETKLLNSKPKLFHGKEKKELIEKFKEIKTILLLQSKKHEKIYDFVASLKLYSVELYQIFLLIIE